MDTSKRTVMVVGASDDHRVREIMNGMGDKEIVVVTPDTVRGLPTNYIETFRYMPPHELVCIRDAFEDLYPPIPKKLQNLEVLPVRDSRKDPKIGRNVPCPCGSGKKYKHCCL